MGDALDDEARRIDWAIARVWQIIGICGVAGGIALVIAGSTSLGLWVALLSAAMFCCFSVILLLMRATRSGTALRNLTTLLEGAIPWLAFAVLVPAQGMAYTLGSWLPPFLFAALIVSGIVRLRPITPILFGVSGSVIFAALYFLWARNVLTPEELAQPLLQTTTQVTRCGSLLLIGLLGALVCQGFRLAVGRAEDQAREKDLFGKYRVGRQIASGGMGVVHEALYCPEGGFQRPVAIKRIHPHMAEDAALVQSFRHEAELSARLVHPNIVQVLDFGRVSNTYFFAMEFVDGMSLSTFMKRHRAHGTVLPASVVAHVARQILQGLDFSHAEARGADGLAMRVIHRDMSPPNVLLSTTAEVKISDFGLARALREAVSTRTKTVAGHVGYMAPEQARGESLDPRCDLFGLGVIIWEMLAGARLFLRDTEATTLLALVSEPVVPIQTLRPDLGPEWDDFLTTALAKEPAKRFSSAKQMLAALDRLSPPRTTDVDDLRNAHIQATVVPPAPEADHEAVTQVAPQSARG